MTQYLSEKNSEKKENFMYNENGKRYIPQFNFIFF
jgi:hypothetical protein